ncbi:MAG: hypothetical protein HYR56_12015 [Acidobacteria bacterium]|nr:hypothetical protein [Acidobacteriota bacterium]MBI3422907.1 hypothetical protein [Acidobacteriota bacterium]
MPPGPEKTKRPVTTQPATQAAAPARVPAPTSVQSGPPAVRLGNAPASTGTPGVLEFKGLAEFKPLGPLAEVLEQNKTSTINARFGNLAQGPIEVEQTAKGKYRIKKQPLPLTHPALARVTEFAPGLTPALVVSASNGKITGEVALLSGKKIQAFAPQLSKAPELLGLAGFTINSLPTLTNKLENGNLLFGLKGVKFALGAAFAGTFNFEVSNADVVFSGNAAVAVKGLANGALDLQRAANGAITGKATIGLVLPKSFTGNVEVAWDGVAITGLGKVGYRGEKFSGEVTLQLMEKNQAQQLAAAKKAPEAAAPKANANAAKKPAKLDYVVFGEGDLSFSFTTWLSGTAHVIVDPKGNVTVIGKITPQKEFILFEQKDYVKQLFKLEARASYGIPVVGSIGIFGNLSMDLFAKLGPAKFYNIVVEGTYSTDPTVAKDFAIRGSLNISAAAGARLRAEIGAVLTILAHDIKAGAGINAIAGVKAYAEATPIIGYREKAAEGEDKKGEWFIRGDLEVAAQPFLGLSGDLFVEIDAPWWSPVPDKKWTWPLFNKEWPLGSTLGMLVSVDYVFGSGQYPKFDFKPVQFDADKFTTNLYEDKAKSGSGKEVEQKGKWAEKNSAAADPPAKTSPQGNAAKGKAAALPSAKTPRLAGKKGDQNVDPNAKTKGGKLVKQHQEEALKKGKKPPPGEAAKLAGKPIPADGEIGETLQISAGTEAHRLWVQVKGTVVTVMLASKPKPLSEYLDEFRTQAGDIDDKTTRDQVLGWIKQALPLAKSIEKDSQHAASAVIDTDQRNKLDNKIEGDEKTLRPLLANILNALEVKMPAQITPPIKVQFTVEQGLDLTEYARQLALQEAGINAMVVADWIANYDRYDERKKLEKDQGKQKPSGRHPKSGKAQQNLRAVIRQQLIERLELGINATGPEAAAINADPHLAVFVASVFADYSVTTQRKGLAESTATARVDEWMATQQALHSPDQRVGGSYDQLTGLGSGPVNLDIGANWGQAKRKPAHLASVLKKGVEAAMKRLRIRRAFWRQVKMNVSLKH